MTRFPGIGPATAVSIALAVAACASPEPAFPGLTGLGPDRETTLALVAPPVPAARRADGDLDRLIGTGPEALVAGERLNADRLRRFYARHGFAAVWTTRPRQAAALTEAVLNAGGHGLAPELFHGRLLRISASLPPLERELVLSDAFLAYADALARGAVPVDRRRADETLTPGPVDIAAALDGAIDSPDPAAAIDALAPDTPSYRVLRAALRDLRAARPAGTVATTDRWRAIEVNLERERWLPRRLPADRVWVNAADQKLLMYRDDRPVLSTRVIVGQDGPGNQSPELQVSIDAVWFNPPWTVPEDIARNEILPRAEGDPNFLARHNLVMLPNGVLQQRAGPSSALGHVMFDMNNRFDVYLHDTPAKQLFLRDNRLISHGCIRVEDSRTLAALVMQQPVDAIDRTISTGDTTRTSLPKPVPVFMVYQTAFADADGKLQFRPDVYGRDAGIWRSLGPQGQALAAAR